MSTIIDLSNWIIERERTPAFSIDEYRKRQHARRAWEHQQRQKYLDEMQQTMKNKGSEARVQPQGEPR